MSTETTVALVVGFDVGFVLACWWHGHKRTVLEVHLRVAKREAARVPFLVAMCHKAQRAAETYRTMAAQNAAYLARAERERDEARAIAAGIQTVGDEAESWANRARGEG